MFGTLAHMMRTYVPSLRVSIIVYRRRRLAVAAVLVASAAAVLAVMLSVAAPLRSDAVGSPEAQTVVVEGDDTIWGLARAHAPAGRDIMSYVAEVIAMNDVEASALQPGMVLRLPTQ